MAVLSPALDDTAKVRNAYLSQYSTTVTVGDAFDNFFGSPKWKAYEEGTQERVDFQGNCTYSGEQVQVRIVFGIYGDTFQVDSVQINGKEAPALISAGLFSAVMERRIQPEERSKRQNEYKAGETVCFLRKNRNNRQNQR